jgi:hypothetical protein
MSVRALLDPFVLYALVCLVLLTFLKHREKVWRRFHGIPDDDDAKRQEGDDDQAKKEEREPWDKVMAGDSI